MWIGSIAPSTNFNMNLPHSKHPSPIVYLIDDDPNDAMIMRRLCESAGLVVRTFSSPQTFLRDLGPEDHGCIVADLLMPKMTGLQLHAELLKAGYEMPIIVVTGHADARTCRTALRSGVYDFVEKTFDPHDLLVVIQEAIKNNFRNSNARRVRNTYREQLKSLSPREREVMKLLSEGRTLKEIAATFSISVQTASKHRCNLFDKLGVRNEVEMLKLLFAIDPIHGLADPMAAA